MPHDTGRRPRRRGAAIATALLWSALLAPAAPAVDMSELSLWDLDDARVAVTDVLSSDGPTVVLFWSLYQPESRQALRALDLLVREGDLGAPALCVEIPEYREGPDAVAEFISRARVRLPAFVDPEGTALRAMSEVAGGGRQLPATYLARPDGSLELIVSSWVERYDELVRAHVAGTRREEDAR